MPQYRFGQCHLGAEIHSHREFSNDRISNVRLIREVAFANPFGENNKHNYQLSYLIKHFLRQ